MSAKPNPSLSAPLGEPSLWRLYSLCLLMLALGECVYALALSLFQEAPGPLLDVGSAWRAGWLGLLALRLGSLALQSKQVPMGLLHLRVAQIGLGLGALLALSHNFQVLPMQADTSRWDRAATLFCAFWSLAGLLFASRLISLLASLAPHALRPSALHTQPLVMRLQLHGLGLLGLLGLGVLQSGLLLSVPAPLVVVLAAFSWALSAYLSGSFKSALHLGLGLAVLALLALPSLDLSHAAVMAWGFALAALSYAFSLRHLLNEYQALPSPQESISRTWLSKLHAVKNPDTSRLGDSASADDTATRDAEDLAFAYAELGIEPPSASKPAFPSQELELNPAEVAALTPKATRAAPAQPLPLPALAQGLAPAVGALFKPLLTRILVLAFAFGIFDSPLTLIPHIKGIYGLVYAASSLWLLLALKPLLQGLAPRETQGWLKFSALMVGLTAALELALSLTYEPWVELGALTSPLKYACTLTQVLAVLGLLMFSLRFSGLIFETSLEQRTKNLLGLLISLSMVLVLLPFVSGLDSSELRWLNIPLSIARIGLGFALSVGLLWWVRDMRESIERIQILEARAQTHDSEIAAPAAPASEVSSD